MTRHDDEYATLAIHAESRGGVDVLSDNTVLPRTSKVAFALYVLGWAVTLVLILKWG